VIKLNKNSPAEKKIYKIDTRKSPGVMKQSPEISTLENDRKRKKLLDGFRSTSSLLLPLHCDAAAASPAKAT
jgi:hypothetical protein